MSRLHDKYRKDVVPALIKKNGYSNVMQVPRVEKVVLNIGAGEAITNAKAIEAAQADLAAISGQHRHRAPLHQVHLGLQAEGGHARRRQGDAAR